MKNSKSNKRKSTVLFVLLFLTILFTVFIASYSYSIESEKQSTYPGIDDDGGWIVQKIERGFPLKIVTIYDNNGGFWSGYKVNTTNEYHALSIIAYIGASFVLTLGIYPFMPIKR